jgi:hydroxyacylglutathione hydrolase
MLQIKKIVNRVFTSNTYVISQAKSNRVWLVDIGEFDEVLKSIPKETQVCGLFLTHYHYDHIYGINKLIDTFPDCTIFSSKHCKEGLASSKMNLSFYHEEPIEFNGTNVEIINEEDKIELFDNYFVEVIETPGHNPGCLSFIIGNHFFTGDSFIPNVEVVTKLKGGDKQESLKSLKKIMGLITKNTILCPGHGDMVLYSQ